jgi:hypothetical protein
VGQRAALTGVSAVDYLRAMQAVRTAARAVMAVAVAVGCGLAVADVASAQSPEAEAAKAIRIEWQPSTQRRGIEGFVYNNSEYRIGFMRLKLQLRDGTAAPTETHAWVYGNISAYGRSPFWARLTQPGEVVAVTIESFRLIARESVPDAP